jgi:exodeoxyribonuclease VII large subunit
VGAIAYFNQLATPPDVLVVIRGGGSLEDLQAFNTEAVARAIAASRTPTLVGVGHEVDVSLADFAADRRAATPTDAARLVVPDRAQVAGELDHQRRQLTQAIERAIREREHSIQRQVAVLERFVRLPRARVEALEARLLTAQRQSFTAQRQKLQALARLLASFDPAATLQRGYAIVRRGERVVTAAHQVSAGQPLMIQLAAGSVGATATTTAEAAANTASTNHPESHDR